MTRSRGRASVPPPPRPAHYSGSHRGTHSGRRIRRPELPLWQELPLLVILAFALALLVRTFFVQSFFIPSGSMEKTLQIRDRVLVNKVVYKFRAPARGEVVVFRGEDSWAPEINVNEDSGLLTKSVRAVGNLFGLGKPTEKDFIKRVIGTPGDTVECCDDQGQVMVNGSSLSERYIFDNNPVSERSFGPITVPAGRLFVMGDHRGRSKDSRAYMGDRWRGTIPIKNVLGRAFVKMWPINHWGSLDVPGTFAQVRHSPQTLAGGPQQVLLGAALFAVRRFPTVTDRFGGNRRSKWVCRPK
ncbi:MAG: signal peptidase I [Corynebacteriales bacterium]|nr:signal peptidase I [Mycobacteriales bacterium]